MKPNQKIRRTKQLINKNPVPWCNSDCERAIKEGKKAINNYKEQKTKDVRSFFIK